METNISIISQAHFKELNHRINQMPIDREIPGDRETHVDRVVFVKRNSTKKWPTIGPIVIEDERLPRR